MELVFVNGSVMWSAQRNSMLFLGNHKGRSITIVVTREALQAFDGNDADFTPDKGRAVFEEHEADIARIAQREFVRRGGPGEVIISEVDVELT